MNEFTKEQMLTAYRALPALVRDAMEDPATNAVVIALQGRFQLHIDTAGALMRETSYLLLGLTSPVDYSARLKSKLGLSDEIVSAIVKDVNEKIFIPLREKMRQGAAPIAGSAPTPTQPRPTAPQPQIQRSVAPAMPRPQMAQPRPTPSPPLNLPGAPRFDRALEDHEEPHINLGQRPQPVTQQPAPQPRPVMPPPRPSMPAPPAWQAPPQQMPAVAAAPPPRPLMPAPPPAPAPAPVRTAPPPPPSAPADDNVVIKEYGSDPYREPFQI